jgi:hypothetical protein
MKTIQVFSEKKTWIFPGYPGLYPGFFREKQGELFPVRSLIRKVKFKNRSDLSPCQFLTCDGPTSDVLSYVVSPYDELFRGAIPLTRSSSRVVIAPSASVMVPVIRGEQDMVGLLLGSRELLCLFGRISRTLVSCSSLSEFGFPGESARYQMQGESVCWWSNPIYRLVTRGGFSEGLGTSPRCHVTQGPDTSSRGRLQVQGRDTSERGLEPPMTGK